MNRATLSATKIALMVLGALFLLPYLCASPVWASETGVLKLKVSQCKESTWLNNVHIEVIICRPGVGQVGSGSGYTDSSGYIELTFTGLEDGDQAQTTVTPEGGSPDSGHTYHWIAGDGRRVGAWDFDTYDTLCSDSWYDQGKNIIHCLHNG